MKKWYQKSIAVVMAAACLFAGGTIGLARDSLPQLQLIAEAEDKLYTGESDGLQLKYDELQDGTIEITKFVDSTSTDIELPAVIDGKSVTSIGDSAFYGCDNLMNIHYKGTKSEWNKISIGDFAIPSDTMIHYKSEPAKSNLPTIRGDVDGNNTVEVSDAVEILNYYSQKAAGLNPVFSETAAENEAIFKLADINNDNEITVQDAVLILTYYAKAASGGKPTWEELINM